jgi:hypothetical protein
MAEGGVVHCIGLFAIYIKIVSTLKYKKIIEVPVVQ